MEMPKTQTILLRMIIAAATSLFILSMTVLSTFCASGAVLKENVAAELRIQRNEKVSSLEKRPCEQGIQAISGDIGSKWINGVAFEGTIDSSKKYAVFSATTYMHNESQVYMFYLPLTTLAWKRIGFNSVILVVGCSKDSMTDPLIRFVLSRCLELDAFIIHIYSPQKNARTISQVGRLFTGNILHAAFADVDSVYLLTSDSDLWPIHPDIYKLPPNVLMLSLNSECCDPFTHRKVKYRMVPMCNIGMRVATWNNLTEQHSILPKSSKEILDFLVKEFGKVALKPVSKGPNVGWFLDQRTISIMIQNWKEKYGEKHVLFIPRNTANDRIDRSNWKIVSSLKGKVDSHLPGGAPSPTIWKEIIPLLKSMYGYNSERYNWSTDYFDGFIKRRDHAIRDFPEEL